MSSEGTETIDLTPEEGSLHEAAMFCDVPADVIAALPAAWPDPVNRSIMARLLTQAKAQERGPALIALADNILAFAPAQQPAPAAPAAPAAPFTVVIKDDKKKEPGDMSLSEAVHARADGDNNQDILDRIGAAAADLQRQGKLPAAFIVLVGGKLDAATIDKIIRYHAKGNQPTRDLWTNSANEDVRPLTFKQYAREEFPASPYGELLIDGMDSKGRRWEKETPERGRRGLRFIILSRKEEPPAVDDAFEALSGMQDGLKGRYLRFAQEYETALNDDQHPLHDLALKADLIYHEVLATTQPSRPAQPAQPQYPLVLLDEYEEDQVVSSQPGDDNVILAAIETINQLQLQKAGFGLYVPSHVVTSIRDNLKLINERRRAICGVFASQPAVESEADAEKYVRSRVRAASFSDTGQNASGVFSRLILSGINTIVKAIVTSYGQMSAINAQGTVYLAPGAEFQPGGINCNVTVVKRSWVELAQMCREMGW